VNTPIGPRFDMEQPGKALGVAIAAREEPDLAYVIIENVS
jgi:hypothetical protein